MKPTALRVLAGLGFTDRMIRSPYSRLSGGWRSRAALAMGLIVPSDVLLLDEPCNFMASRHEAFTFRFGWLTGPQDLQALLYLEQLLANPSDPTQTLVLTSHDRAFLDNVAEETILLRHSQLDYASGTPSQVGDVEAEAQRAKGKERDALQKKREHVRCHPILPALADDERQIEASISEGRRAAKKSGDENRSA